MNVDVKYVVLREENYKTQMKEIKEELNKWKNIPCSWVEGLKIVMSVLSNWVYRFNQNGSDCFVTIDKLTLKFIQRDRRPRIANSILKSKGLTELNFNTYYKALVIKIV